MHLFWKEPTRLRQNSQAVGARIARPSPCPELSAIGNVVEQAILQIPDKYPTVHLEKYAVMPNHVHLLLLIQAVGARIARPYGFQHRPTMKELRNQTPPLPHLAKILP